MKAGHVDPSAVNAAANQDRRRFLGASTALVLGSLATTEAAASESGPQVRVAVVGTGARGSDLIRKLTTIERARLVAICDDYPPHQLQGAKYAGQGVPAYDDYRRMLEESKPQAVVVATPLYLHSRICLEALEAGCAVFCEKTMCHSVEEARHLADVVNQRGAVFQVGLQRRANAVYRQAQAMVETGMLGQITAIKCQWHRHNNWRRPVPIPRGERGWHALEHRLNWRLYQEYSQGLMAELASHQMDVVNRLLGTVPQAVLASGGIDYWRDGREVADNVFCIYEYQVPPPKQRGAGVSESTVPASRGDSPYTVRVTYSSIQNNAYEGASELVMGTRGSLFLTQKKGLFYQEAVQDDPGWSRAGRVDRNASIVTSGKTLQMANDPWAHRGKPFEIDTSSDDTRDELLAFLDSVARDDPRTICDAQIGLDNTATVLMGNQAVASGSRVEFPRIARRDPR